MSKIICDVCGTSYPESVSQCPICGCVRSVDSRIVTGADEDTPQSNGGGSYTFVKGGRFSKSNVKKRQKTRVQEQPNGDDGILEQDNDQKKADKGLLVAFIVLLISVVAVICYILVKFLSPETLDPNAGKKPVVGGNDDPVITTEQNDPDVTCQSITLSQSSVTLDEPGATFQLQVILEPADTTDIPVYESSDGSVATVTDGGLVTAVGTGEATVTVSCGEVVETFTVTVSEKTEEPTLPSVPDVDLPVVPAGFELKKQDITFAVKGQTYVLYSGNIPSGDITWTSSDPKVATVSKGKVTAVSKGKTTVTAEYKGAKLTCIVRCKDAVGEYVDPETQDPTVATYKLNKTDVSIDIGESFDLYLLDENNQSVDVTFTNSNSDICSLSGSKITGVSAGRADITVTHEGVTYTCIVRVRADSAA